MPEDSATDGLYQALARPLWALLYSRCCDRDLALEAVQEAFLRLHQHAGAPILEPRAWLLRVAQNWISDQIRRGRRAGESVSPHDDRPGPNVDPAIAAQAHELHAQVGTALAHLCLEDREVLVLRYALDWRSERIAEALQSTAAAIDMRLSRARRRMADALASIGVGHEAV
jgi:RNA polymerase sigma-70 factor (ECF subfamily)